MKKYLADILTLTRVLLSCFLIVWGIFGGSVGVGFVSFALAELTDAFDGTCSRKWPFPKGKEPKYRKYAVKYDMMADALLWFAAVLFFTLRIDWVIGLVVMLGTAIICGVIEMVVYGRLFGHPDNCTKDSLCARDFKTAKKIVMRRRQFYLATVIFVAIGILANAEWELEIKMACLVVGLMILVFLWFFLETRRKNISRDAIELEKKMLKKRQK